ncbi:MAG: DUF2279 domain-containing protein [Ignavibacteria bacterium]|mgnify:FL=1|nr:DUF2279 domain-containing protein [Ignavibacteria bacterium]
MKKFHLNIIVVLALFIPVLALASGENSGSEISLKLKESSGILSGKQNSKFKLNSTIQPTRTIYDISDLSVTGPLKSKSEKKSYKVSPVRLTILGVMAAGAFTGFHIYYANTWWKDQRDYFKFAADGYYARNMDKASHIYTANFFASATSVAYEWAGLSPSKALMYGAITSLAYETYIEINDGFAPNWGFDWGDMGANVFGAVYPILQNLAPPLKHINFKWSFNPEWIKKKTTNSDDLLDDYTNMTFWLSVNPMLVLPKSVTKAKFYPNFLALALGMSIQNASHVTGSTNAKTEWFLALDWDVNQLPGKSDFMKKLKKILNFYHFPSPAVKFSPEGVWYGLYF